MATEEGAEDRGSMFLWNISIYLQAHMAQETNIVIFAIRTSDFKIWTSHIVGAQWEGKSKGTIMPYLLE
jgi:hypothetical protein